MDGRRFGPYVIRELLGRGGMGEVYRAYDTAHDRDVALKLLPAQLAADPEFRRRFSRESRIAAQLGEPHVVPIHAYGELNGTLYIDMQLIEGRDLAEIISVEGPLAPERAVPIVEQVAQALDGAHARGLLHRDVKPANVLVTTTGDWGEFAYVGDFGISRSLSSGSGSITGTGATVGTVDYMAPERFTGHGIDHRVDVYSLACVLFECLTAQRPFPREEFLAVMYAHLHDLPPAPSRIRPGLPVRVDEVIARGMAKDPDHRYPSCFALAAAARVAMGLDPGTDRATAIAPTPPAPTCVDSDATPMPVHGGAVAPPRVIGVGTPERRRRVGPVTLGLAVAAAVALVGLALVYGSSSAPETSAGTPRTPSSAAVPTGSVAVRGDPAGLALSPDGTRLFVNDLRSGVVQVIDTHTQAVVREIPVGGYLHGIALSPDGRRAYVGAEGTGAVSVIDTAAGTVVASIPIGPGAWLWGIAVSPDGRRAYVTSRNTATFAVIDTATNTVRAVVPTGAPAPDSPVEVAFSPDGRRAYLTDRGSAAVTVVDATSDTVVATVGVQNTPNGVVVGPDGRVYVTNEGAGSVSTIDPATLAVTGSIAVGDAPITVVTSPDGARAYVVDRGSKAVSVVDTAARLRVRSIPVGGDPGSITISPDGRRLYVCNGGTGSVMVLDPDA